MRVWFVGACVSALVCVALAQQPVASGKPGEIPPASTGDASLKSMFEAKIKTEWDALKNKDKKSYGELLAEDYQGVEVDGRGERNKTQAINEVVETNVYSYSMSGLKVIPVATDAAFVIYEITMQFPPKAQVRYSRIYIGALWVKRGGEWKEVHYQETHVR